MKNRFISFLLALVLICQLFTATIPITVNATSQSNYPPYASIEYEYSSSVTCGTIRYIRQSVNKTYFYWDYWPSSAFGNYSGPGNECGTACISMALSYIGINKTPYDILKKYNGSTVFDGGWGATYTTTSIEAGMNNYMNGNGKYSPVIIHLNYGQSIEAKDDGHFVLIVGKVSDNVWQIMDPATESLKNYTINGSSITYMGINNTIDSVRQYFNPNAAIVKDYAKDKCTPYPCAIKIKITEDCCPYTQPCNPSTASELGYTSEKLTNKPISKNEVLTADALYENTEGNYWYHVTLSDGTKAYLYSTHTTRSSIIYPWVDGGSFPSSITGTTNLQGTVTTGGSRLDTVQALVCRQGTTSPVLRSDLVTVNATTYPLKSSTVDKTTVFGNLSNYGSGYYTLMIDTAFTTYYADNNQLKSAALCDYAATYDFYYGQPTVPNVTITFNANGGSCSTSTKVIASGSAIGTLPTATRSGYTFDGWYTSASGGNKISTSTTFSSNTTVYAHWSASTYTVSYNANGGSGAPSSQTATVGNYIDLSWEIPTRFGYSFQGWATDSSASSVVYWPGDVYTDDTSITLYAVWRESKVLSGDTVGQFGEIAYINCPDAGVYYAFIPNTSTEYRIMSESDEDVCVDLFDANGNLIASDDDSGDGTNFLLTYHFTANETYYIYVRYYSSSLVGTIDFKVSKRYSITYDANGGTGAPETQYHFYDEDVTLNYAEPVRAGYAFVGWSIYDTATNPDYLPGDICNRNIDLTLYAVWEKAEPTIIASGICGDDLVWSLTDDGCLTISGTGAMYDFDYEGSPWYDNVTNITSVEISNRVTHIGDRAFQGCLSLPSIDIPDSVTSIGVAALAECESLTSVEIPDGVTTIGGSAFNSCTSLTTIEIPYGVTAINMATFANCHNLCSVEIPDSVTTIGVYAFQNCISLSSVEIPDSVTTIDSIAFQACLSLSSVVIPSSVTTIDSDAFNSCSSLATIYFNGDAPEFGGNAFYAVTATAYYPAYNLTWTEAVTKDYGGDITWVADDSGHTHEYTVVVTAPTCMEQGYTTHTCRCGDRYLDSYTSALGHSFTSYVSNGDATCTEDGTKTAVCDRCVAEDTIRDVGSATGHHYEAQVTAPTCTEQGYTTYTCECSSSYIAEYTDALGHNLTDWIIVQEPTDNEDGLEVRTCTRCNYKEQRTVTKPENPVLIASGICGNDLVWQLSNDGCLTISGTGAMFDFEEFGSPWSEYIMDIKCVVIEQGATSIGEFAFKSCLYLTSVQIPDSVSQIGALAFESCDSLPELDLPSGLSNIGMYAFSWCSSLSSITIPGTVNLIADSAFSCCDNLEQITFKGNAPIFEEDVFYNVTAEAYYPRNTPTWTVDVMQDYGGTITWIPYQAMTFTDVPEGSFYYEPVMWAIENGITNGTSASTFGPNDQCMRAHVVTFLWRAVGSPEPKLMVNSFVDVKPSDFYYTPVLWALENGITSGMDATHFGPTAYCNRAQVVTFLYRTMGSPAVDASQNPFTDVAAGSFYEKPVLWAVENGITNGMSATTFGPGAICNRAQIVTFLYRAFN